MHCIESDKVRAALQRIKSIEASAVFDSMDNQFFIMSNKLKCPLTLNLYTEEYNDLLNLKRTCDLFTLVRVAADNLRADLYSNKPEHRRKVSLCEYLSLVCAPEMESRIGRMQESLEFLGFNVMLRFRESIVTQGYVYTAIHGKEINQLITLQAGGKISFKEEAGLIQPSIRKYKLNKYLFKILSDLFLNNGKSPNAGHILFPGSELVNSEEIQMLANDLCQRIEQTLAPLNYIVLKGAQCVAAYSNKCSHTSSCMQNASVSTFLPYIINPDTVRILVGVDKEGYIKSRRIIYKIKGEENAWYAGRVYASDRIYYEAFDDFLNLTINKPRLLTIPTVGDNNFFKLIEKEYELSGGILRSEAVAQEALLHKLYDFYTHKSLDDKLATDEQYNFIDSTANCRGPHGTSQGGVTSGEPKDYRTDFYYPVLYKGQGLSRCRPYADDLMGFMPGNEFVIEKHPDMPDLLTVKTEALVSFDERPNAMSVESYRNQLTYRVSENISELCSQELHYSYDSFANLIGNDSRLLDYISKDSSQFPMKLFGTVNADNRSSRIFCVPVGDSSYVPYIDSSQLIATSQWILLPKSWLTYRINEQNEGCISVVPPGLSRNKSRLTDLRISSLSAKTVKGIPLFELGEDGQIFSEIIDIERILPNYLKLAKEYGINDLMIDERTDCGINVHIYSAEAGGFQFYVPEDATIDVLTYEQQYTQPERRAYTISKRKYLDCRQIAADIVELEPTIYSENKKTFASQAVNSLCGVILKPHARRLKDGSIVHKEVYDAFRKVESFTELQNKNSTHTIGA